MDIVKHSDKRMPSVSEFDFNLRYIETVVSTRINHNDSHVHPECEIYINLSGNVSFICEQHIYPISPGSIIITRPYEYHHCIYHSDDIHKHFWILFSAKGNEAMFDRFFNRPLGENNLLSMKPVDRKKLCDICFSMLEEGRGAAADYRDFFNLIDLINSATVSDIPRDDSTDAVSLALEYIDLHFCDRMTVTELAELTHVSVNTLERHFSEKIGMSPAAYIKKKRLANAAIMLSEGASVTDACFACGFSDYSGFISSFKKSYGVTPLKYKNFKK